MWRSSRSCSWGIPSNLEWANKNRVPYVILTRSVLKHIWKEKRNKRKRRESPLSFRLRSGLWLWKYFMIINVERWFNWKIRTSIRAQAPEIFWNYSFCLYEKSSKIFSSARCRGLSVCPILRSNTVKCKENMMGLLNMKIKWPSNVCILSRIK